MAKTSKLTETVRIGQERALLVQVLEGRRDKEEAADSLAELERLADTAGAVVVGHVTQRRDRPTAAYFVGEGKVDEIRLSCASSRANLVIFDNELSSVQVNNLDLSLGVKVIDRTELILQIFARRAVSAEAQIQVELAQLEYLVSRLPTSIKQSRFTGGIGMRGPGESPLQLRNEPMRKRIRELKRRIGAVQQRRRAALTRRTWPRVCLVGYTNAGKSTLLNAFSPQAQAYVDDRLFATLDTKTRRVRLPDGGFCLMTDTVGFIRHLPHGLVASFKSTLQVAVEADLLLIVVDAGHGRLPDHLAVVGETLKEIGADGVLSVLVLNKADTAEAQAALPTLLETHPDAAVVSAATGLGLDTLKERIVNALSRRYAYRQPG